MAHNKGHDRAQSERRRLDRASAIANAIFFIGNFSFAVLGIDISADQRNRRDARTTVPATIGDALTNSLMRLPLADARHAQMNNKQTTCVSVHRTESESESNT